MKADDQEVPARNYDVSAIRKLLSGPRTKKRKVLDREQTGFHIIETIRGLREVILQLDGQGHHDLALAVSRYFVEMGRVIAAVSHHICDDAVFILDVSDSWLGPVHVDTDVLFGSLLRHFGFVAEDDLPIAAAGEAGERTRRVVVFWRKGGRRN